MLVVERTARVEARPVRLGLRTLDAVEVLDGLAAGDRCLLGVRAANQVGSRARRLAAGPGSAQRARPKTPARRSANAMGR